VCVCIILQNPMKMECNVTYYCSVLQCVAVCCSVLQCVADRSTSQADEDGVQRDVAYW